LDGEAEKSKNSADKSTSEQTIYPPPPYPKRLQKKTTESHQIYPPPPYPKRLQKQNLDTKFAKFLEVFKKLHINIPFAEALEQMPSYAKFMKGILSRKLKLEDLDTVALTEECSAVLQQKLPPKLKDPGSFTIPCTIGNQLFSKCLCDLGASINLMPMSVFKQLGLPEPKPVNMTLQLADRSITYPRGIVEDVLVKVDKLIFPADFVILDFEEDKKIPIILGRPFLATGRALIDVQKGELTMRVSNQKVIFNVFKAMKFPTEEEECFSLKMVDTGQRKEFDQLLSKNSDMHKFEHHISDSIDNSSIRDLSNVKLGKLPPHLKYVLLNDELVIFKECEDNVLRRWNKDDEVKECSYQSTEKHKHLRGVKKKKKKSIDGKVKVKFDLEKMWEESKKVIKQWGNGPSTKDKSSAIFEPP
jgi:hypothetical protein